MSTRSLDIVVLGLSVTSSWGNGHATTYRGLLRELTNLGHSVTFLERDVPWYASNRDLPNPAFCKTILYNSVAELQQKYAQLIREADLVIVGSYVPEGVAVGDFVLQTAHGVTAFYDIDTPVTLAKIDKADFEYLHPSQISRYKIYLSFTGGPTLDLLQDKFGSPMARALYCSFDPDLYYNEPQPAQWDLGYLGTYSADRQPPLEKLLLQPATTLSDQKFVVAGPQYPHDINWPQNVQHIHHLPPAEHRRFYNSQRFTLNITRADMIKAGYSPSVRLFEAAACATPVISDYWDGIHSIFEEGTEILIARSTEEAVHYLSAVGEEERKTIGANARAKVLAGHTAAHRAKQLESYYYEALNATNNASKKVQGAGMAEQTM